MEADQWCREPRLILTMLAGPVRDQSALYGLIDKARDLGLTLVAVGRSAPPDFADEPRV